MHPRLIATGGVTLLQTTVGDFTIAEAQYAPGRKVPVHSHVNPHVGIVLSGACRESNGRRAVDLGPLSLAVKTPGDSHTNEAGRNGTRYLLIDVAGDHSMAGLFDEYYDLRSGVLSAIALRLRAEIAIGDGASRLAIEGLVLELLAELSRSKAERPTRYDPPWLRGTCDAIRARLHEPLALAAVAREIGVHPTHLARTFRRRLGVTPGQYLRRLRLERATSLLAETNRPLADVSAEAGFYDQSHLTNVLRRGTGLTPAGYRRLVRGGGTGDPIGC
jgi:AraC family transcriptional regulator